MRNVQGSMTPSHHSAPLILICLIFIFVHFSLFSFILHSYRFIFFFFKIKFGRGTPHPSLPLPKPQTCLGFGWRRGSNSPSPSQNPTHPLSLKSGVCSSMASREFFTSLTAWWSHQLPPRVGRLLVFPIVPTVFSMMWISLFFFFLMALLTVCAGQTLPKLRIQQFALLDSATDERCDVAFDFLFVFATISLHLPSTGDDTNFSCWEKFVIHCGTTTRRNRELPERWLRCGAACQRGGETPPWP